MVSEKIKPGALGTALHFAFSGGRKRLADIKAPPCNAADLATSTPSLSTNANFGYQNSTFAILGFVLENGTPPSVGVLDPTYGQVSVAATFTLTDSELVTADPVA